jgi:uncharacterized protein YutE (UPF0331/DUF86 family)
MGTLDLPLLAEKVAAVERHLLRVATRLPDPPASLEPDSDAADVVILHLWQAVQIVIDVAISLCIRLDLGTPSGYGDAFRRLEAAGHLGGDLSDRLVRATGFRNVVAHAYSDIDFLRVEQAARHGPADLRAFLVRVRDLLPDSGEWPEP